LNQTAQSKRSHVGATNNEITKHITQINQ
jgi:hypothetical protein